ncbi:MAG: hypothetical protein IJI05_05810, partial [Erysipelotrichaceae bacterium]|nr:hypothetical protein [Erysipelotrichaceae bacterium]
IKILMMIFMTLDHVAYAFLSPRTASYMIMRFFGRMVAPTMCYLLVEGFIYTSSIKKYIKRMLLFALVSYWPFLFLSRPQVMLGRDSLFQMDFSMLFTLALCLVMLQGLELAERNLQEGFERLFMQFVIISAAIILSMPCDWHIFGPCYTAVFYLYRKDDVRCDLMVTLITLAVWYYSVRGWPAPLLTVLRYSWFCAGSLAVILIRRMYSHQTGSPKLKHAFYIYYPLHLAVIDLIKYIKIR